MLLATVIHINDKLSLLDVSQALWKDRSSVLLESVIATSFSV